MPAALPTVAVVEIVVVAVVEGAGAEPLPLVRPLQPLVVNGTIAATMIKYFLVL